MGRAAISKLSKTVLLLAVVGSLSVTSSTCAQETPVQVSACQLAKHPKSFDGKMIRVRGTLSVYFEDFSLVIRNCDTEQGIWLAFGGDVPGIVASMANDTVRKPGVDIKVQGVAYGIEKDENFRRLYALIAARHGDKPLYSATATLTGAFFAGEERKLPNGRSDYAGYGHLGCCALLVITKVSDVESVPPANLNLSGTVLGPDGKPVKGLVVFDDVLGGSPPERQQARTSGNGKFEFSNSGQLFRVEDPRYRPLALPVEPGGTPISVKLEDAKQTDWLIPPCGHVGKTLNRIGFSVLFTLPKTMESSPFNETGVRAYFVFQRGEDATEAEFFISNAADEVGASFQIRDSQWSEQRWIRSGVETIVGIDSRGRYKEGGYWRTAFFFDHISARYSLQAGEQASDFDKIIDSACAVSQ